ncbi:hypothetical protein [Xylella fastidiosa]|uniref:hypothetical protein n=1 Tax=Xylella fastidiosa TaxID=2371 RepID=UPI001F28D416|nr:hypothetical protein [Xylella fastidiosa]WNY19629.1 hypothetical protein RO839_03070 [Xylella fastidiosa]
MSNKRETLSAQMLFTCPPPRCERIKTTHQTIIERHAMEKQKGRTVIKSEEIKSEEEGLNADAQIVALSKRIEFYLTEYSVELLAKKMNNGDFIIPAYQREYT